MLRTDIHRPLAKQLIAALSWRREPPLLRRSDHGWLLACATSPSTASMPPITTPRRALAASPATASSARCWRSRARSGSRPCRATRPSRCCRPTTRACSRWEARSASGARSRCARLAPPTSTACSTPARSASRCRPARSPGPTASTTAAPARAPRAPQRAAARPPRPGPSRAGTRSPTPSRRPGWWPAMTRYVADMNAAWHTFAAFGRPQHPRLRVVFAMLAGGAPLHGERLAARGGPAAASPTRARSTTRPPTARGRWTRSCGASGSISSSTAPTGRSSRPRRTGPARPSGRRRDGRGERRAAARPRRDWRWRHDRARRPAGDLTRAELHALVARSPRARAMAPSRQPRPARAPTSSCSATSTSRSG